MLTMIEFNSRLVIFLLTKAKKILINRRKVAECVPLRS